MLAAVFLMPASGQCLEATARVDTNRISTGESVNLRVVIRDGKGDVDTDPIKDFRVISRGTSTNVSIVNGDYSKTVTHSFDLIPLKPGRLTIPALTVSDGRKTIRTDPVIIEVSKTSPANPETASGTGSETGQLFARAALSGGDLFLGQQAIYTFRLYSAVRFSNARLQQPDFTGFSAKEAGERKNYVKAINGIRYEVTQITYVIIPEQSGRLTIGPAVVTCEVPVRGRRDPFGDSFFGGRFFSMGRTKPMQAATRPLTVRVSSLPPFQGDTAFSGLVGKFSLGIGLDRNIVKSDESVTLTLTVSGTGNIMDAQMPELVVHDSFKVYEDLPEERIELTPRGYSGEKIFKRALVPVTSGSFAIDPVTLTYFNQETQNYETVSTPELSLSVEASELPEPVRSATPGITPEQKDSGIKKSVEFTGRDILALKEGTEVLVTRTGISLVYFLVLIALPCFLFFLLKGVMRMGGKEEAPHLVMAKKALINLKKAESPEVSKEDFLKYLYSALVLKIRSRGDISGESLTFEELSDILSSAGCTTKEINGAAAILGDLESARYSGISADPESRKLLLTRVKTVIKTLGVMLAAVLITASQPSVSRADGPRGGSGTTASSIMETATQADDSGTLFLKGVNAYKNRDFHAAAEYFSIVAKRGVVNGELYYNIGNAHLKAGDTGRAILWYERAKKLIPLDPDLKFNMDHAAGFVKDKPEDTGIALLDFLFFWKSYLSSRVVQYTAILFCMLFFSYAGFRTVRRKRIFTLAGVILFCLLLLVIATALFDYYQQHWDRHAVILSEKAAIRSGTSDDATELFVLHAGTRVTVKKIRNGYLKIVFSRGKIGWVKTEDIEVI